MARRAAQQRLVVSIAAVVPVYAGDADPVAARAARELRARLRTGFHQVITGLAAR